MGINITLPRSSYIVKISDFSNLEELLFSSNKEYLQKPATSLLMFRRIIAYAELVAQNKFSIEEIRESLKNAIEVYNSITEHEALEPNEIEEAVENRLKEDEFNRIYNFLLEEISNEILKIFASGAVAQKNQDVISEKYELIDFKGVLDA